MLVLDYSKLNDLSYTFKILTRNIKTYKTQKHYRTFNTLLSYLKTKKDFRIYLGKNFYNKELALKALGSNDSWHQLLKQHPYLTYNTVINTLKLFEKHNMIYTNKGYCLFNKENNIWKKKESKMTTIYLRAPQQWKVNLKPKDSAFLFYGQYYNIRSTIKKSCIVSLVDKSRHANGNFLPERTKLNTRNDYLVTKFPANHPKQRELNYINSMYSDNLQMFKYNRHYGKTSNDYGRYYGLIQNIPKAIRKKVLEHEGYTELDFAQFIINCFYLVETGKKFNGDIYKNLMKHLNIPSEHFKYYRDVFKQICIIIFNSKQKNWSGYTINEILREAGLNYYTPRKQFASPEEKKEWLESVEYYEQKTKELNNIPDNIPLYTFTVYGIQKACEIAFKDIDKYLYKMNAAWTQNVESKITRKLLIKARQKKHTVFSIHDAIIVPKKHMNKYNSLKEKVLIHEIKKFNINKKQTTNKENIFLTQIRHIDLSTNLKVSKSFSLYNIFNNINKYNFLYLFNKVYNITINCRVPFNVNEFMGCKLNFKT